MGHRLEGKTTVILIKSGNDHPFPVIRKFVADCNDGHIEELYLIDPDDLSILCQCGDLIRFIDDDGFEGLSIVRDDLIGGVTIVDTRFEDDDLLTCDLRSAQSADEFFGLTAEHAAGDDLDPPDILRCLLLSDFHTDVIK